MRGVRMFGDRAHARASTLAIAIMCPGTCSICTRVAPAASSSAAASNAYAAGYAAGSTYAALPGGCSYAPVNGASYYACNGMWLQPAYGANGVFYRVVAAP